ncbi:MAG: hypothetical protein ABIK53_06580 [bacterium]
MKKGIVVGLVVLAVCSCLSSAKAEEKGKNLAPNPGFEDGTSVPDGWSFVDPRKEGTMQMERTLEDGLSGKASCKVSGETQGYNALISTIIKLRAPYPTKLELSAFVKGVMSGGVQIYAWGWLKDEDPSKHCDFPGQKIIPNAEDWNQVKYLIDTKEQKLIKYTKGQEIVRIQVWFLIYGNGTVYFDDVSVTVPEE